MFGKKRDISKQDLRIDRRAIATLSTPNDDNPNVIEIGVSLFAIPKEDCVEEEYNDRVKRILSYSNRMLRSYVSDNSDVFDKRCIVDLNFTTAKLRKGYNKSVHMSMFVRKKGLIGENRLYMRMKEGLKPVVNAITLKITEEGFVCHKRKQAINKRTVTNV